MRKSPKAAKRRQPSEAELTELRARLEEAESTIEAIRSGQVEALVVASADGPRVFTLEGADHRYRRLVETMNEGALLVSPEGLILYCNAAFAAILGERLERVVGRPLVELVEDGARLRFEALRVAAKATPVAEELQLRGVNGAAIPVHLSMSPNGDGETDLCAIVTNLTAQKRNEEILASERLARSILDQAAEAIVVCDADGVVTRVSHAAQAMAIGEALHQQVVTAFPLRAPPGNEERVHPALLALKGEVDVGVEWALDVGGRAMSLLCTAAPLLNERKDILGCVLSLVDITSRKRAEAERAALLDAERAARSAADRARVEAEASNRSKDEFLATISHELRTPLNAIVGWARLISDGIVTDERRAKGIEVIRRNADAQARLIEDLLDVSRIISGKMRIASVLVEPRTFIEAVLESVRPALEAKEIQLETSLAPEPSPVLGDEARLQQVVWNLVSNAVKFTPRGGKIGVTLRRIDGMVEIEVADSGRGIRPDFLPYVFDRFRQADGGISRAHGGLGLGLAISRHLVELHGGRIEVASKGEGAGATFTLRLPHATTRPSVAENESGPPESAVVDPEVLAKHADLHDIAVVVVEDDDDSRELLVGLLTTCGASVRATASGVEALDLLSASPSDVLISDIGMPTMDGYSLIRRVRTLPGGAKSIPAIALTAYARPEDRRRALAEGFQMHLAKPVDPAELAMVVASLAKYSARVR